MLKLIPDSSHRTLKPRKTNRRVMFVAVFSLMINEGLFVCLFVDMSP